MELSFENLRDFFEVGIPFNRFLGIRLAEFQSGWARLELPFREEFIGDPLRPALHGGLVSTLLDTCGGMAVFTTATEEIRVSTIDMRVDFLRPGGPELLVAESKIVRAGNRVAVTDGTAYHPGKKDDPVATCKAVYNIKRAEPR